MKPLGRGKVFVSLLAASLTGCSTLHIPFRQTPAPPLQTGQGSLGPEIEKEHQPPPPLPPVLAQTPPPALPPVKQRKARHVKKTRHEQKNNVAAASQGPLANAQGGQTAPSTANQSAGPVTAPPLASNSTPAASAIAKLTAGDSAMESATKRDTENLISQTEQGLAAIKRPLTKDEQTTAGQIRTFLNQAKQALGNGDAEGADTLATKARLLLDELTKQ